ncbi:sec1 family domain-containing protein MIP3 [Mercurialis annua]|uniref:sec1 family domain-containing protein MIP3 n=1 Tax=Mercurialis annua TaxID=3986 RepID=UPI00215EBA1D|nr:sec1 family domain-containing protein MIP3 [Mercurialis annua]XP_050210426.1 sec1 family domain-containing protein MIP3 [Mercurialis annua]
MALIDVTKACLDSIDQMAGQIGGSILYLDSGCTESFQIAGVFPKLLELGVRAVCSLENMCSLDAVANWNVNSDPATKIVAITSRLLSDAHRYILRCLSMHQGIEHFIVCTSISEVAHSAYPDSPLGPDAFREYESLLLQDYEELVKKRRTKSGLAKDIDFPKPTNFEGEGWSRLTSSEEEFPQFGAHSSGKIFSGNDGYAEDEGKRLVVSVHHFPMIFCPLSPRVFVLPSESSVAEACLSTEHEDSLSLGLPPISSGAPPDGDDVPAGALLTAHFLYHLATKMDMKMEIFSLGDLSKTVGKIMTDMSSLYDVGRRKRSAGLLLIDRTLDLFTPCCHGDSLVDRIFSALPRRERTTNFSHVKGSQTLRKLGSSSVLRASLDVQIPLANILTETASEINSSPVLESIEAFLSGWDTTNSPPQLVDLLNIRNKVRDENSAVSKIQPLNGSLVSTETFRGTPYMEALFDRKTKDGAVLVRKWLQETLRRENITINVKSRPGFVTVSELNAMTEALAKSQSSLIRNKGIIQLAAAVIVALEESRSSRWDAFISAEKILSASAGDTSQSLAAQIGDLIYKSTLAASNGQNNKTQQALLSFEDALFLMVAGYILAGENFPTSGSGGPFSWEEEHSLKEAVMDAILENASVSRLKFLHSVTAELEANFNKKKSKETTEASPDKFDIDDFDDDQWGKWGEEEEDDNDDKNKKEHQYDDMQLRLELRDKVDSLFKFFHKLSTLKMRNKPLRDGASYMDSSDKGLLYKILRRVLDRSDVPGLDYHSSAVGRLFKSGFGRFGLGQAKPSLADQNVIMVFIIGGINGIEVREAWEAVSESGRPDIELIVGGTTLLTPDDMLDLLMGNSSYL